MPKPNANDPRGVLITRPEADAAETAALVRARGLDPVVAPIMVLRHRVLADPGPFDAVVTTSRNAVPALTKACRHKPLLAVGSATAARARAAGFETVLDAEGDATDLAALTSRAVPAGSRLLFAHGLHQGDTLAAALVDAGFIVTRRCAYAVQPARRLPEAAARAIEAATLRSAMFLSTETARAFVRLLPNRLAPLLAGTAAIAIGRGAAEALAPLPWHLVRVSVRPTLDEVLALL